MKNTTIQEAMAALDGEDGKLPYDKWVAPNPSVDFLRLEYFSSNTTASYRLSILANTSVTRQAAIIHQGRLHVVNKIMNVNQTDGSRLYIANIVGGESTITLTEEAITSSVIILADSALIQHYKLPTIAIDPSQLQDEQGENFNHKFLLSTEDESIGFTAIPVCWPLKLGHTIESGQLIYDPQDQAKLISVPTQMTQLDRNVICRGYHHLFMVNNGMSLHIPEKLKFPTGSLEPFLAQCKKDQPTINIQRGANIVSVPSDPFNSFDSIHKKAMDEEYSQFLIRTNCDAPIKDLIPADAFKQGSPTAAEPREIKVTFDPASLTTAAKRKTRDASPEIKGFYRLLFSRHMDVQADDGSTKRALVPGVLSERFIKFIASLS